MPVIPISSKDHFSEIAGNADPSTLVVIYFHTPWAAPCAQMTSVFQSLSDVYSPNAENNSSSPPASIFISLNADEFPDISESFDVSAVPFFILLRDSTILKEISGADPKELANAIQSQLAPTSGSTQGNKSTGLTNGSAAGACTAASGEKSSTSNPSVPDATAEEHEETEAELHERLTKLVSAAPVMLFMKGTPAAPSCGFSRQLVALLREHQVRFGFFDILKDNSVRQGLKTFSDWPTFPQLYINGELQGGLDIIKESVLEDPDFFKNSLEQAA